MNWYTNFLKFWTGLWETEWFGYLLLISVLMVIKLLPSKPSDYHKKYKGKM